MSDKATWLFLTMVFLMAVSQKYHFDKVRNSGIYIKSFCGSGSRKKLYFTVRTQKSMTTFDIAGFAGGRISLHTQKNGRG